MSMDDRRMQLARNELLSYLDKDTCSVTIDYARYTEVELVLIALQNKIEHRNPSGFISYMRYYSGPIIEYDQIDSDDDLAIDMSTCYMWICNNGTFHPNQPPRYIEPPLFTLGFGGPMYTFDCIAITLDNLLPTSGLKVDVQSELVEILDICRPIYLADIQSDMDVI